MSVPASARLNQMLSLSEGLMILAQAAARRANKSYREYRRVRRGSTLRPGSKTPLWNDVARMANEELHRYGAKARLGRILGVPRQRVHQYVMDRTACPDAERTLLLLAWLQARRAGRDFA